MQEIFNKIYTQNKWGFLSGTGSFSSLSQEYIQFIKNYIQTHSIQSVVDLGSGDFRLSREIFLDNNIHYWGIECVEFLVNILSGIYKNNINIEFKCFDFFKNKENIPNADLFIIKDVLQHWPNFYIYSFLDYLVSSNKTKNIIIVNSFQQEFEEEDIYKIGEWRGLSAIFLPLKKYNPEILLNYNDKEISIINVDS